METVEGTLKFVDDRRRILIEDRALVGDVEIPAGFLPEAREDGQPIRVTFESVEKRFTLAELESIFESQWRALPIAGRTVAAAQYRTSLKAALCLQAEAAT